MQAVASVRTVADPLGCISNPASRRVDWMKTWAVRADDGLRRLVRNEFSGPFARQLLECMHAVTALVRCRSRCAVRRETVRVRCLSRLGAIFVLSVLTACTDSGASSTTTALPVQDPSTTASAVAAVATTPPETSTSPSLSRGEILVAAPGSTTSSTSNATIVLFDARRAFSTPSGTMVFQRADPCLNDPCRSPRRLDTHRNFARTEDAPTPVRRRTRTRCRKHPVQHRQRRRPRP